MAEQEHPLDTDMAWALTAMADYRIDLTARTSAEYDLVKRFVLRVRDEASTAA